MVVWADGKDQTVNKETALRVGSLLAQMLSQLTVQIREIFGQEHIEEIRHQDKAIEVTFGKPENIPLDSTAASGDKEQRLIQNVRNCLFIIEDKQMRGLDAHVIVGSEFNGILYYTCWTGKPDWRNTLKKNAQSVLP